MAKNDKPIKEKTMSNATLTDILGNLGIQEHTPEQNRFSGFDSTPDKQWIIGGDEGVAVYWWEDYEGENSLHVQCADEPTDDGDSIDTDGYTMLYGYGQASDLDRARACVLAIAGLIVGVDKNAVPAKLKGFLNLEEC